MKKINILLVICAAIASLVAYPTLPARIPMHWNIAGEIDNWMPKSQAVWFFPLMVAGMWLLFQVLPLFDPKKAKYTQFAHEWEVIQVGLLGFFVYLQIVTFYIARNLTVSMMPLMFIGLGSLFILLGNYLSKIRQNYFIGIKIPWTLNNEDNWNKTHRFASWCFVGVGILMLVEAYAQWYAPYVVFGGIMLASIAPMIYSFLLFKKML